MKLSFAMLHRHLPLMLMCALPLYLGARATSGLRWPHDADLSRNIAIAQTMAEGDLWGDAYYLGERLWYNPLLPAIVAVLSRITDVPVPILYLASGPYLTLLAPIAFYVLVWRFFGHFAAVAATFHWLFLRPPRDPAWAIATFTPWLFASNIAQIFFYVGLLAYRRALVSNAARWYAATGAALGAAFLVHAAPALLFGGMVAIVAAARLIARRRSGTPTTPEFRGHLLLFGLAFVLALGFVGPIFLRYRFHIVNPAPNDWIWGPLSLEYAPRLIMKQLTWLNTTAVLGAALMLRRRARASIEGQLALLWLALSALLIGYGLLSEWASFRGVHLQNVVPIHHFWFYLKGVESVFWACGLAWLAQWTVAPLGERAPFAQRPAWRTALLTAAVAVGLLLVYPSYAERGFFTIARQNALKQSRNLGHNRAYRWIRANTQPRDVFLAWDGPAQHLIGTSGRKTIVIPEGFSNPYVEWHQRSVDRRAMFEAIWRDDMPAFRALADRYSVTYVLSEPHHFHGRRLEGLEKVFEQDTVAIYRRKLLTS